MIFLQGLARVLLGATVFGWPFGVIPARLECPGDTPLLSAHFRLIRSALCSIDGRHFQHTSLRSAAPCERAARARRIPPHCRVRSLGFSCCHFVLTPRFAAGSDEALREGCLTSRGEEAEEEPSAQKNSVKPQMQRKHARSLQSRFL